ncbi:MAG: N-formylglutamate amidohydrolase [Parasphingorhabdus sp.]|uniref:N-formylglutamate amidohydrolase n=1 Tax=Parasphingorhabdus sp. TaxID=2709688 RepID=UPI003296C00A
MTAETIENLMHNLSEDGPFTHHNTAPLDFPLLISVPHAGRVYPRELLDNLAVPVAHLLRLEDRYADRLASAAIAAGFPAIIAHHPRAWVDLNRNPTELDADMINGLTQSQLPAPSRKVRGGLGLIPSRLHGTGNLWRKKWQWDAVRDRIDQCHEPYHHSIAEIMERLRAKFGCALLLDIHSMPPPNPDPDGTDIVVGDRFGRSAGSRYSERCMSFLDLSGFKTRLNHPYAGGYILERHSHVERDMHAIQLEVNRDCYLDSAMREPSALLPDIANLVLKLAQHLVDHANSQFLLAAE